MKILIADDSAFMRTILKDIIGKSSWKSAEIFEAEDGEDAINKCNLLKPDLMLLDNVMPKKTGMEVLKQIGTSAKNVIIISSIGQESTIEEEKSLGAKSYILKPFDPQFVVDTLNKFFIDGKG